MLKKNNNKKNTDFLLENNVYKLFKKCIEVKYYVTVLLFNEIFFFYINLCAFGKFETVVLIRFSFNLKELAAMISN